MLLSVSPDAIKVDSMREMVAAGLLLAYDPDRRLFRDTDLSIAAAELLRQAEHYRRVYEMAQLSIPHVLARLPAANRANRAFDLSLDEAVSLWALYHSLENLYRRVRQLYGHFRGLEASPLPESLLPTSPLGATEEEQIQRRQVSRDEIREWTAEPTTWRYLG